MLWNELIKHIKADKKRKLFFTFFFFSLFSFFFLFPFFFSFAASSGLGKIVPDCAATGDCTLEDFLLLFINLSKIILGIVGALALVYFIVGGFMFLTSGGSQSRVKKGKDILIGTLTGLIIVMTAWLIVYFIETAVGIKPGYTRLKKKAEVVEKRGFCVVRIKDGDSCRECKCLGGEAPLPEANCKDTLRQMREAGTLCEGEWVEKGGSIKNCGDAIKEVDFCSPEPEEEEGS